MQGSFGCLYLPLDAEDNKGRGDLLENVSCMNNIQVEQVGISQIRNVYMPIWQTTDDKWLWNDLENMLYSDVRRGDLVACFYAVASE